nr:MAG TPA: hypothetical protein [Caudoviricetes sp.]
MGRYSMKQNPSRSSELVRYRCKQYQRLIITKSP